jgi:hypothetical protein
MALSDILIPLTAKQIGPAPADFARPRVYYLKSNDLQSLHAETVRGTIDIKEARGNRRKIECYESPDDFLCAQALSQGATANAYVTKGYQNLAPTSSATAADQNVSSASRYYNEISSVNGGTVRLPDPFVRRVVVINNLTTGPINVKGATAATFGATNGTLINGLTAAFVLPALKRIHFVAPTAGTAGTTASWMTAIDA